MVKKYFGILYSPDGDKLEEYEDYDIIEDIKYDILYDVKYYSQRNNWEEDDLEYEITSRYEKIDHQGELTDVLYDLKWDLSNM